MGKQHRSSPPGGGNSGMLSQPARLQEEMRRAQRELEEETVTVVMTGDQQVRSVRIASEVLQQADPDLLGGMLTAAFNQAAKASKDLARSKLGPWLP
jgi:DNA-binding protein YbaB